MQYLGHSNFEDTINIASFLDPRFKAQHLGDELSLIKQRVVREGVEMIRSGDINEDCEDIEVSENDSTREGGAPHT